MYTVKRRENPGRHPAESRRADDADDHQNPENEYEARRHAAQGDATASCLRLRGHAVQQAAQVPSRPAQGGTQADGPYRPPNTAAILPPERPDRQASRTSIVQNLLTPLAAKTTGDSLCLQVHRIQRSANPANTPMIVPGGCLEEPVYAGADSQTCDDARQKKKRNRLCRGRRIASLFTWMLRPFARQSIPHRFSPRQQRRRELWTGKASFLVNRAIRESPPHSPLIEAKAALGAGVWLRPPRLYLREQSRQ